MVIGSALQATYGHRCWTDKLRLAFFMPLPQSFHALLIAEFIPVFNRHVNPSGECANAKSSPALAEFSRWKNRPRSAIRSMCNFFHLELRGYSRRTPVEGKGIGWKQLLGYDYGRR